MLKFFSVVALICAISLAWFMFTAKAAPMVMYNGAVPEQAKHGFICKVKGRINQHGDYNPADVNIQVVCNGF